ncbi:MAG: helicase-exonuclease AddAB subunit AddA [Eubacteriales bacterium]|nr:helicase-exonuclease AddAB subunit AddA [Eubacteriales bacterium]
MGEFTPTAAQKDAIEISGCSVLVSAGAGSGKTKVLTERLMRYVLGGPDHIRYTDIDRFVIITFTQAAAGELRSRITDELMRASAAAENDPNASPDYKRHIRRQQALIGNAQIGTIHHFCLSILRENSHNPDLALSPDFKIMSDERSQAMKEETISDILDDRYAHMGDYPGFEELLNSVGSGRDDSGLSALVLQLYDKMQCHAFPEKWASKCINALFSDISDIGETPWGKEIINYAKSVTDFWISEMDRLIGLAVNQAGLSGKPVDNLSESAEGIRALSRCLSMGWDSAVNCPAPVFGRLTFPRNTDDPETIDIIRNRRNNCKDAIKKVSSLFVSDTEILKKELSKTAPEMKALLSLTTDFQNEFSRRKILAGYADYSDLEHKTASLLMDENEVPSSLAREIASRYTEIMVDEYQDVSRVQDAIFRAVSDNGNNLFMVGDVKQAIYRFRLADPEIFNEKYNSFTRFEKASGSMPRKILLRENFRSRNEILECANSVFSCCMSQALGDTDYNSDASLIYGSSAYSGAVPVPQLTVVKSETGKRELAEASYVAGIIENLIRSRTLISDGDTMRPAGYGDIAILLRTANSSGGIYRQELIRRGIPAMMSQGGGFFETREISLMFSLLKIMDNPHRDAELIAVLSSPIYGFTPDELALIRASGYSCDFWSALQSAAETVSVPEALKEKAVDFISEIRRFRTKLPDLTADQTVRMLITETRLQLIVSAMPDGEQRALNLERLITIGAAFENDGQHGLHRFILHLERLHEKDSEIPAVAGDSSAVKIVSIHKSKGLEYPIVFLCDAAHQFNMQDSAESVLVHPVLGLGPFITDPERRLRCPTLPRKAIALRIKREALSEEMRLLYVALTRPKEYLYITASSKDPEKEILDWRTAVAASGGKPEAEILSASRSYLGWLLAAAFADGEKNLKVNVFSCDNQSDSTAEIPDNRENDPEASSGSIFPDEAEEIRKKLEYVYPYEEITLLPSKVTATELKTLAHNQDPDASSLIKIFGKQKGSFRKPEFMKVSSNLTGAEKGIATHLVLQYINFEKGFRVDTVEEELNRLYSEGILSARQKDAVSTDSIVSLFSSSIGKRMAHADKVYREFRFSLLCDAEKIIGTGGNEQILLQGVVDCCFEESDGLVIVDYKTDQISSEEDLACKTELYSSQIKAYADALERILCKPVKEAVLYFLSARREISTEIRRA